MKKSRKRTNKEIIGYARARATRKARIHKECTKERHEELSKTVRYCPLCRHPVYADRIPAPISLPIATRDMLLKEAKKRITY